MSAAAMITATVALPFSARRVARIGIGTTVTHIGGHSVKEGLVPLDIMLEAHVETDEHGLVFAHQPHIWADPLLDASRLETREGFLSS